MGFRILFLLIFNCILFSTIASAEIPLKAAFIRDHQLWIKNGDQEIQLTNEGYVNSPQWSHDGQFLAYLKSEKLGEASNLFIYDMKKKENYKPYVVVETSDFKWSPINNQLAYTSGGVLNVTKMKNGRPHGFENVALGVNGFEWFPNGKEFIVSSQANLLPTGWGPVQLFRIPIDAKLNSNKIKSFYTIKTKVPDLFFIYADYFKWSYDGKWVSFIGIPTASWSMDSNTLCVLSEQGEQFQQVGKMLGYPDWVKWAPASEQLAYISGEGRFFVENKNLKIKEMPTSTNQREYTPKGFVDLDLEWYSSEKMIVARAKENKEWEEGPVPTMKTALYLISLKTNEQYQLTNPRSNEFDIDPQAVSSYITWVRKASTEESHGDVWMKKGLDSEEEAWLKNVDSAPVFFKE
ncbi:translocation protein TolB [Metabacillus litoralis]|uniref:translocation protein TolB n=1 Tax=Metabacillus litoralis TaxID=152268 RepID=UPI002040B568|nr:translocation protein TolB [Metabacillus litoralis]MCM3409480.1 translocation protein TolB [Metabacillus litoralis]